MNYILHKKILVIHFLSVKFFLNVHKYLYVCMYVPGRVGDHAPPVNLIGELKDDNKQPLYIQRG